MKFNIIAILFVFLVACKTTKPVSDLTQDDIIIKLKKGGCFGECPVYTFNMYEGGYCEFIGQLNTSKIGTHSKQVEKDDYKEIIKSFKEAKFEEFEDFYDSNIPDLPMISMSYNNGKSTKTIKGKRERPTVIHRLQFKLEQIAESEAGWKLLNEETTKEDSGPKYIKSQIVLVLVNGNQLAKWFNQMREEHGIRILKKLSNDEDSWLVSYDNKKYSPEKMLEILRNDKNVKKAEFNLEVQN